MKRYFVLVMITVCALILFTGCEKQTFNGSRTGNESQFILDFTVLNETKTHKMDLEKGTVIDVVIQKESGKLDIVVLDSEEKNIYTGNDVNSSAFKLTVPQTGKVHFSVTGKRARGSVSFKVLE